MSELGRWRSREGSNEWRQRGGRTEGKKEDERRRKRQGETRAMINRGANGDEWGHGQ